MSKRYIKMLSGLGVGALLGFGYYYYIGCVSGTCAITSNPYISTAYGALIGVIFIWPDKKKAKKDSDEIEAQSESKSTHY